MPTTGELNVDYKEYGSRYKDEQASPGYYTNYLTKYDVKTEVTATPRTGVTRFTFPKGKSHILLNLGEGPTNEYRCCPEYTWSIGKTLESFTEMSEQQFVDKAYNIWCNGAR